MKIIRGTVCVSVMASVPADLFERRQKEYERDGLDPEDVLHDFLCEAGPGQTFEKKMGDQDGDWVEFFCDAEVDAKGFWHDAPTVEDDD